VSTSLARALGLIRDIPDFPEPGVLFRDLSPLFADGAALRAVVGGLGDELSGAVDVVVAVEARGFLLGGALAQAHGLGLVPVRKPGKLPVVADRVGYTLEYGTATLELPEGALVAGQRVAIVDDVLATGGTVAATCELVERAGASVEAVSVVLELAALDGRSRLEGRKLHSLLVV
jgi:adenine phosphoribosyltransferase